MNIERTCRITLTSEEIAEALTDYVRSRNQYGANAVKAWEEVLDWHYITQTNNSVEVLWGEKPQPSPSVEEMIAEADALTKTEECASTPA